MTAQDKDFFFSHHTRGPVAPPLVSGHLSASRITEPSAGLTITDTFLNIEISRIVLNLHDASRTFAALQTKNANVSLGVLTASYLQLCLRYGADQGVARLLKSVQMAYVHSCYQALVGVATRLIDAELMSDAESVISHLCEFTGHTSDIKILRLKFMLKTAQFDELHRQFVRISLRDYQLNTELLTLRVRYECMTGRPDTGLTWLEKLGPLNTLPVDLMWSAAQCLNDLGRFEEALPLLETWLSLNFSFKDHAELVLNTASKSSGTLRLVRAIEVLHGWFTSLDLLHLRSALLQTIEARHSAHAKVTSVDEHQSTRELAFPYANDMISMTASRQRHAIFLCADTAYNVPALVALTSLAMSITQTKDLPEIYMFVLPETHDIWLHIAHCFAQKFTLTVQIVSTLQINLDESRAHYGFQNYGKMLSITAYARLYASRYLQELGITRALYLDSDIVVRRSPTSLLHMDMEGYPLAARTERTHPRISRAIKLHGIPSGRYFNSGILLLDFQHPATQLTVNSAIAYSEQLDNKLLYLDQCALNKAVQGLYLDLDERFNWFIVPDDTAHPQDENATIVHFISTPKPWDLTYSGRGAALWAGYKHHAIETVSEEVFYAISEDRTTRDTY
ncbi:glycosyltransferase family 8 protein [Pectobacterium zantedeschiae]|uniref:Glycosyl transferase n=1 Tax=Pectobacterium zantedeschiae TaxID=2034769 RepID=A0A9X8P5X2_9GAMM|nr:glycosyltransferase [Pectobacterium zantedeschiae]RYC44800.1 glycosyl transferase [Pectobacterium zantedeschiae]RYC49953.1 glycosyl transferase [Pectobacterium zantedeschiae]